MPDTQIVNFVVSTYLGDWFDLDYISYNIPDGDYDPGIYQGVTYVIENPKCAVLIQQNGKVSVTGTRSMEDAQSALEYIVELLKSIGISANYNTDIKVRNIVGYTDIGEEIDLHPFYKILNSKKAEFNPESFPGIIYRMGDDIDMLIFQSGKIVFTGASSIDTFRASAEMGTELIKDKLTGTVA